ncbi:MAG TPA: hypothetical protein QF873_01555 [Patescibacteria group bacterium]|nr:hypothetical protein [Patescibacteria group bacterium]
MSHEVEKKTIFRLHLIIGVIVLLFALVALVVQVVDRDDDVEPEPERVSESQFEGIDGSLTVFAFDLVAGAYKTYLDETEVEEVVEFEAWLGERLGTLPQTDTYQRQIQYRAGDAELEFVLFSAGEDNEIDTIDDYIKTYTYEPTAGNL